MKVGAIFTVMIPGEPCAQGRGRATVVRGKGGKAILTANGQPIVRVFDPKKSRDWKATAQQHMRDVPGVRCAAGPVSVSIYAVFTRPKSSWLKRNPKPREWHAKRPDADNIAKAVKDAAKGVLWLDDSQVAVLTVRKFIGAQEEAPYTEVRVCELLEGDVK